MTGTGIKRDCTNQLGSGNTACDSYQQFLKGASKETGSIAGGAVASSFPPYMAYQQIKTIVDAYNRGGIAEVKRVKQQFSDSNPITQAVNNCVALYYEDDSESQGGQFVSCVFNTVGTIGLAYGTYRGARPATGPFLETFPEWKPGGSITQTTPTGRYPQWFANVASQKSNTVQGRYWMNRAHFAKEGEFTTRQLAKMRAGFSYQAKVMVRNHKTGKIEIKTVSKELHHHSGNRGIPGFDEPLQLREVWPWEHEAIDNFRHTGYEFIRFVED